MLGMMMRALVEVKYKVMCVLKEVSKTQDKSVEKVKFSTAGSFVAGVVCFS